MIKLSIGIAAYNAERNIEKILSSLLRQKKDGFIVNKILVHSDQSSDQTNKIVSNYKDQGVELLESEKRVGFIGSFINLIKRLDGDVTIIFNDDIVINDNFLLSKLVEPFVGDPNIGLVCGRTESLPPINFLDKAQQSTYAAYDKFRYDINEGHTVYTVDGKILALSRNFVNNLKFPENLKLTGCVDAFMYFSCIQLKLKYFHVRNAVIYFRNPTTTREYIKWTSRNNSNQIMLKKIFGDNLVSLEYRLPRFKLLRLKFIEFLKNPIGCLYIFILSFYISYITKKNATNFDVTWDTLTSSKKI